MNRGSSSGCILCGSRKRTFLFSARDFRYDLPGSFSVVECSTCRLAFISPQPSQKTLQRHYPPHYYTHKPPPRTIKTALLELARGVAFRWLGGSATSRSGRSLFTRLGERIGVLQNLADLDSLRYIRRESEVLEIGFGAGLFLDFLARNRIRCTGIETDTTALELAGRRGHNVLAGELENLRFPQHRFDFIRMRHVLEHVRNPLRVLQVAHRIHRPSGYLHIEVPNFGGLFARAFRDRWVQLEAPRHLFHFQPETLVRLVKKAGYEPVSLKFDTQPWHLLGSLQYVLNELRVTEEKGNSLDRDVWEDGSLSSSLRALTRRLNRSGFGENIILLSRRVP